MQIEDYIDNELQEHAAARPDGVKASDVGHVLIVDDEETIRILLKESLLMRGYEISLAATAAEAEEVIRNEALDVMIVDIFLGEQSSGLDLLPLLSDRQPHTPAIVISGAAEVNHVLAALKAGAYDLLGKPFNLAEVEYTVRNAVEKKRLGEENARLIGELRNERDQLEKRVDAATRDLGSKVRTLHALNEQITTIFEMSQAGTIEAPAQEILEHIIELLRNILTFDGAVCVALDLRSQDISLKFASNTKTKALSDNLAEALLGAKDRLIATIQNTETGTIKDVLRREINQLPVESLSSDKTLFIPLFVPQMMVGVFGVTDITQPTNLTDSEERILAFAISHYLAALEQRGFQNRTNQLASFGELVTEIAHDLRHPMTSMRGASKILQRSWADEERRERCLAQFRTDLSRMESLTSELVYFYKPDEMSLQEIDLHELVGHAMEATAYLIDQNEIEVVQSLEASPSMITGISRNLVEALVNLIVNAIQAMDKGGRLTVASNEKVEGPLAEKLRDNGRRPEKYLSLSFTDTGKGIKEDDLEKIFQRFYTTRPEGTGLGLSAVNRIIKKNLGVITVESKPGVGSTFTIGLPRV